MNIVALLQRTALIPLLPNIFILLAKGGLTVAANLAFACMGCNGYKQDKTDAYDPISQTVAVLYHLRIHSWHEHFAWNEEFTHIVPLTLLGA